MAKILLIDGENIKALDKVKFTEESKLQNYLEKYPSLIPLGEIVEEASGLLCIGKEVGVPSGAIDLLFIDKDGLLTLVETKLVKNPEIRREVIGQIIEYASYVSQWTADKVYEIANTYLKLNLDEIMEKMNPGEFLPDDFKSNVDQNLKNGKIRLIIAIDELVESLRATITFLNSHSNFDVLLLQVSSFEGKERDQKILAPSLFGYAPKTSPPRKRWDRERFLGDTKERCDQETVDIITKLFDFTKSNSDDISWGTGAIYGSFTFRKLAHGLMVSVFTAYSDGSVYVNFGPMKNKGIKEGILEPFRAKLNEIPSVRIAQDVVTKSNKYPYIMCKKLSRPENLKRFQDAVLALCQQIEPRE